MRTTMMYQHPELLKMQEEINIDTTLIGRWNAVGPLES